MKDHRVNGGRTFQQLMWIREIFYKISAGAQLRLFNKYTKQKMSNVKAIYTRPVQVMDFLLRINLKMTI